MADQTVKISNLPSEGSAERVAYDLYLQLRTMAKYPSAKGHLDLYAECLEATRAERTGWQKTT